MAGMGFELRKIFAKKAQTAEPMRVLHSSLTTLGASLIFAILLFGLGGLLNVLQVSDAEKEIFFSSFAGSSLMGILISSVVNSVLSRYVSDKIMEEKESRVCASLFGSMIFNSVWAAVGMGLLCFVQWKNGTVDWGLFVLCYLFGVLWTISHSLMVYATTLRKCSQVIVSCMAGAFVFGGIVYGCYSMNISDMVAGLYMALVAGLFVVDLCLVCICRKAFGAPGESYFEFLGYFKKHAFLWGSGLLFFIGFFIPSFLLWFYAGTGVNMILLCNLPGVLLFECLFRKQFYAKYNMYIAAIEEGSFEIIEREKITLQKALKLQLVFIYGMQFVASVVFTELSVIWMRDAGTFVKPVELLPLEIGMAFVFCMYYTITFFCYFSGYKESFVITTVFAVVVMAVAVYCYVFANTFYTLPLFIGGGIGWLVAFLMLRKSLKDLNAYMLCK